MRTIVHGRGFEVQLTRLGDGLDSQQLDDFMFAWDFILARNPELGIQIIESPAIWMSSAVRSYHLAPVNIFYTFTPSHVYLLGVTLASDASGYD